MPNAHSQQPAGTYACLRIAQVGPQLAEVLVALLADLGFDSFEEEEEVLVAYCPWHAFDELAAHQLVSSIAPQASSSTTTIAPQNWNEVWESNFNPVVVADRLLIRAPFHTAMPAYPLEVVIQPKMAFGTGHHATTYLMAQYLLLAQCQGCTVLDAGTGTGVLAIVAAKLGASTVHAYDYDPIAVQNTQENAELNKVELKVWQGTAQQLQPVPAYHLVLANINRNVLLQDLPYYAQVLLPGGQLYLSGFYATDVDALQQAATQAGLQLLHQAQREAWVALHLARE